MNMSNYRTLVIDDEAPAREIIKKFLSYHEEFELIGEFEDGFSGLKGIRELSPDLVFLDIQMPRLTGLELLELLEKPPVIIFSTAYDQYALEAFEMSATDYLLKPYSRDRFEQAIVKALQKLKTGTDTQAPVQSLVTCERCGTRVRAAKFCECCGHPIRVEPPKFCPQCGASLRTGIRFCTNCAAPLS